MSGYSARYVQKKLVSLRDTQHLQTSSTELHHIINILTAHTRGLPPLDQEDVISEIVDFLPMTSTGLCVKKLLYHLMVLYTQVSPELLLHASSGISADMSHPNPIVRATCVAHLPRLRAVDQHQSLAATHESLIALLRDKNESVRRMAVQSCMQILKMELLREGDGQGGNNPPPILPWILHAIKTETSPEVVVEGVLCLVVCDASGEATQAMLRSVLKKIKSLGAELRRTVVYCANRALNVDRMSDQERLALMNDIDPLKCTTAVTSTSRDVAVEAYRLMLRLSRDLTVHGIVVAQACRYLIVTYQSSAQQMKVVVLHALIELATPAAGGESAKVQHGIISESLASFLPRHDDLLRLKVKKLELLKLMASHETCRQIHSSVRFYLTSHEHQLIVKSAFDVLVALARYQSKVSWQTATALLHSKNPEVVRRCVLSLATMLSSMSSADEAVGRLDHSSVTRMCEICSQLQCPVARDACLWLLSLTGEASLFEKVRDVVLGQLVLNKTMDGMTSHVNMILVVTRLFVRSPKVFHDCCKKVYTLAAIHWTGCGDIVRSYSTLIKNREWSLLSDLIDWRGLSKYDDDGEDSDEHYDDGQLQLSSDSEDEVSEKLDFSSLSLKSVTPSSGVEHLEDFCSLGATSVNVKL